MKFNLIEQGTGEVMSDPEPILEVYQVGPTTVVGFGGREVFDEVNVALCREEMLALIDNVQCKILAFDLTGVKFLPSGLLGLLASIRQHGAEVHLYNACKDIQEGLEITKLNTFIKVHHIDVALPNSKEPN